MPDPVHQLPKRSRNTNGSANANIEGRILVLETTSATTTDIANIASDVRSASEKLDNVSKQVGELRNGAKWLVGIILIAVLAQILISTHVITPEAASPLGAAVSLPK